METKWFELASELCGEEALLGERITAQNLKDLYESGYAIVREEQGSIIGFAALWDTPHEKWREIGSVWVSPHFRGKRLATEMFESCVTHCHRGVGMLVVTHNPKIIHLAEKAGFKEATCTTWDTLPWEVTCGPCDRLPEYEKQKCPFRAKRNKCALFFV